MTGGRQGIGRAIAATLATEGARVVIASRDAVGLANAAEDLQKSTAGQIEADVVDTGSADSVACARAVLPHMITQRWGRDINVGGLSARNVGSLASFIRNSAVTTLSKNIADENGALGINANIVQPGPTDTERLRELLVARTQAEGEAALNKMIERVGIGRLVTADEVAAVVTFLASPLSVAINGITLDVGGGTLGTIFH